MASFLTTNWGPVKTIGRYAVTSAGSIIAALGVVGMMSQTDAASATQAIKNLVDALGTIATSLATLAGVGGAVYATIRGTLNSTVAALQAEVANQPDRIVVKVDPSDQGRAAIALAKVPEAKAVITNTEIARSIPIGKVVGPESPLADHIS